MIGKTIAVLVVCLIAYYVIGTGISKLIRFNSLNAGERTVFGFLCYQVMFQICALLFIWYMRYFHQFSNVWIVIIGTILLSCLVLGREMFISDIKQIKSIKIREEKWTVVAFVITIGMCIIVTTNGELNYDSEYYIGVVSSTLASDLMYRTNAYTGELLPSLYLRRAFVTFEIDTAWLCKVFKLQAIIATRLIRGATNVVLTGLTIEALGQQVYKGKENVKNYSRQMVIAYFGAVILLEETMYTGSNFFLHRAYEGKAFASNVLLLFVLLLFIKMMREKKKHYILMWGATLWACLAISSSAIMICGIQTFILILVYIGDRIAGNLVTDSCTKEIGKQNELS